MANFGDLAEPTRKCTECGEPESDKAPLMGTQMFGGPVRYYCQDVRECADRHGHQLAAALARPLCQDGSGHLAETCPGTWHFPAIGGAR